MRDKTMFANSIAELYRRKGDTKKMTASLLNGLDGNPENLGYCQMIFQRFFETDEDYSYLKEQLYNKLQDKPDNAPTIELLAWVFLQKKDYKNAFRQLKALDRMQADEGSRIFEVAKNAENDKDYDAAIEGYNYIATEKGVNSLYNLESKRNMLNCKRKKLTDGYNYSKEELTAIEAEYETLLGSIGRHAGTASIMMELADMQAFYLNNLPKAVETLAEVIKTPNVQPQMLARAKISLGDFYLMQGENWEATLLYSQVDKAFKDDVLGHEARYRNAKLAYFKGDFDWAKAQFSVLKASTSKLISNDAIDMDVFIMDNSGLDSNYNAMLLYAEAELLVFQNRFNEAFLKMDSITQQYPKHALEDDLYYLKAKIYVKKKDFKAALTAYNYVVANYSDGIRADNSLFDMATLYENALNDKEKAKELYYKLFTEYDNSTLAVESRKKYRILRGDKISQ
jgi:TolA-binding protein